jgi:Clostridial hydrophobic W
VARGLHIFRYVSFQGTGVPAISRLIPPSDAVEVIDMPGREDGVLQRPGDCLVVRAGRASDVVVALRRGSPDGSLDATFRLEPIVLSEDAEPAPAPAVATAGAAPLSFVAHLANRGDTAFAEGEWAGGPDAPAAIEGMQIVAEGGDSALELQVFVGSRPPRWSEWVGAGQYAGTRGHGLSLLGLRLRVKPEAQGVEIAAEALFLGALVASQRGRQVEFVSASGVDPLIGVKFGVESIQEATASRTPGPDANARDREPRVRVFRASAAR